MPRNAARPGDADYGGPSVAPAGLRREKREEKAAKERKAEREKRATKREQQQRRVASQSDEEKHPRGKAGTSQGGRFVKKGDTGEQVSAVQKALGIAGQQGTQAGVYDAATASAVVAFQRSHGLEPDGIIGRQTSLALAGQYERARNVGPGKLGTYSRSLIDRAAVDARERKRARRDGGARRSDPEKTRRVAATARGVR